MGHQQSNGITNPPRHQKHSLTRLSCKLFKYQATVGFVKGNACMLMTKKEIGEIV